MNNKLDIKILGFVAVLVVGGFIGGQLSSSSIANAQDSSGRPIRTDGSSIFADVAEAVGPGVVFIRTERVARESDRQQPFNFFKDFFPDQQRRQQQPRRRRDQGGGSGFVFDANGHIFTNYHVVKDADRIRVVMAFGEDEREFDAEVVGVDPLSDIAIIKIDPPKGLRVVPLGDSKVMRVGDWVMAIGTPFGQLQGSATVGIVSAKGRNDLNIMGGRETIFQNYIQTDASINFGNSGGPLVNTHGEAIGINTAINPSGQGIGFAIPINHAKSIMEELIERGKVAYGYMGISLQQLNSAIATGRGMDIDHGILVQSVVADSPADAAGLQQGDVIVVYNKVEVRADSKFRLLVGSTPVGDTVSMRVVRSGKERGMKITIGERPDPGVIAGAQQNQERHWLGLEVEDASTRQNRRRFEMDNGQDGVVVVGVEAGSPADEAGIREGDIITEVYSREVSSPKDYAAIAKDLKDRKDPIAFLVKSGRSTRYIPVYPEER